MQIIDWKALMAGLIGLFITQYIAGRFVMNENISWGIGVVAMILIYNYIKYGRFGRFDRVR